MRGGGDGAVAVAMNSPKRKKAKEEMLTTQLHSDNPRVEAMPTLVVGTGLSQQLTGSLVIS